MHARLSSLRTHLLRIKVGQSKFFKIPTSRKTSVTYWHSENDGPLTDPTKDQFHIDCRIVRDDWLNATTKMLGHTLFSNIHCSDPLRLTWDVCKRFTTRLCGWCGLLGNGPQVITLTLNMQI